MSTNHYAQTEHDALNDLAAAFPALHEPSDCIATVRRIVGLLGPILRGSDKPASLLDADAIAESASDPRRYSLDDVNRVAKELRAFAAIDESSPTLNASGLVMRLAPDIAALLKRGYAVSQVADILAGFGIDCTKVAPSYLDCSL